MNRILTLAFGTLGALVVPSMAHAQAAATPDCATMISNVETQRQIPHGLLMAIALTESGLNGRPDPYAMNIGGRAYHARDTADMERTIATENAHGEHSIDVGCMQINLKYHGHHFARPTDLLDPATNVNYGASFLIQLAISAGSWRTAVMDYHNKQNPGRRYWYGCKVWNNYLRTSASETGYLNCGAAPKGSSTAAIVQATPAKAPSPIQLASYASQGGGFSGPVKGMPQFGSPASTSYAETPSGPTIGGRSLEAVPHKTVGTLELASAGAKLGDITTSDDNHADAFKPAKPMDWSGHVHAVSDDDQSSHFQTSMTQGGFGHVAAGSN